MTDSAAIAAARAKLAERAGAVRTGGAGTARRTKKPKTTTADKADDKKLQTALKRLGVQQIPQIEEANLFKADGNVIHIQSPKVQASVQANTFILSGNAQTKPMAELLPGIVTQLGRDMLTKFAQMAQSMQQRSAAGAKDDEVPDLEGENFEDVA